MNNIDLISVFSDDDYILDDSTIPKYPQDTPRANVGQLRHESLAKFESKWSAILEKYLKVDDSIQSDEVDLATGIIYTDNGHLRLMKEPRSTIWIDHDSVESQDMRQQQRKRRTRLELKKQGLFTSQFFDLEKQIRENDYTEGEKLMAGSLMDLKTVLKHSKDPILRNRSQSISPAKRRLGLTGSLDCDDNILLVTPSPKKRKQEQLPGAYAPNEPISESSRLNGSPRAQSDLESASDEDNFEQRLFLRDYVSKNLPGVIGKLEGDYKMRSLLVSSNSSDQSELLESLSLHVADTEEETSDSTAVATYLEPKGSNFGKDAEKATGVEGNNTKVEELDDSVDFSDEFSIVSMSSNNADIDPEIFTCPFTCVFGTGNKLLFAKHLLENHPESLAGAGYPTQDECTPVEIDKKIERHLHSIFPIVHPVPPLPITPDLRPLKCWHEIDGKRCEKWFLSRPELSFHLENTPHQCSSKRQVLLCPVLGCGFMTDEGYLLWRDHLINAGHCRTIKNNNTERCNKTGTSDGILDSLGDDMEGYTSIDELFND